MKPIFIIGYRCTGKTSTGLYLAEKMGLRYKDADDVLVARAGKTVADLVADSGWGKFRDMEAAILTELSQCADIVIATGGGVILRPDNIRVMHTSGVVVWLTATVETIARRMERDLQTVELRPALGGKSAIHEIADVLAERMPLYRRAAQIEVATDNRSIREVGDAVWAEILRLGESAIGLESEK